LFVIYDVTSVHIFCSAKTCQMGVGKRIGWYAGLCSHT